MLSAGGSGASTPQGAEGDYGDNAALFDLLSTQMQNSAKTTQSVVKTLSKTLERFTDVSSKFSGKGDSLGSAVKMYSPSGDEDPVLGLFDLSSAASDLTPRQLMELEFGSLDERANREVLNGLNRFLRYIPGGSYISRIIRDVGNAAYSSFLDRSPYSTALSARAARGQNRNSFQDARNQFLAASRFMPD